MGLARNLIRAVLDLPTEKPAVPAIPAPPRSLGMRVLSGAVHFVADNKIGCTDDLPILREKAGTTTWGDINDIYEND